MSSGRPFAALDRQPGLAEQAFAVLQGRGLGACDVCQTSEVGVRDLAERDAARLAVLQDTLGFRRLADVPLDDLCGSDDRGSLVEGALTDSATPPAPSARVWVAFEPRWPDAPA